LQRFICIHGHFYQPPRENAWLETVERQDSAYPYHDWNQRIDAECYAANAGSRILDGRGHITRIVNNYSRISFNFGPTLLSWLADQAPETYAAILEADRVSAERFSGHGSAMAQVYSHPILPLCNDRDRATQVRWGVRDFEHRFGRRPEGMWLPETAVDVVSLEALAAEGIRFTILAPTQARAVRERGESRWRPVDARTLDPGHPYLAKLPSGAEIALFFYHGPMAQAVAFERLLSRGEEFAGRLLAGFEEGRTASQLVHIATDGETYGHHHRHGDMALAWALHFIEAKRLARITNYGEYLERHPPVHEVEIHENSAWSCDHELGRWRRDCGCRSGDDDSWNQRWREPLRTALNELRDTLSAEYDGRAGRLLRDPWAARDDYVDVILDRSLESIGRFLDRHALGPLDAARRTEALRWLELQRHCLLMQTSCAWFFDEVSGIETLQVLQYAGRALQLAETLTGSTFDEPFLRRLEEAKSNIPEQRNARVLFETKVRPAAVDLAKVGANHAAGLLFETGDERADPAYEITLLDGQTALSGRSRLALGRLQVASRITLDSADLTFGFVHLGDHNLTGGARPFGGDATYRKTCREVVAAFEIGDLTRVVQLLDQGFGELSYSLRTLFKDEQQRILDRILQATLDETEAVYRGLYENHGTLMRFLTSLDTAPPRALKVAGELVLNNALRRELERPQIDPDRVRRLINDARSSGAALDEPGIGYCARQALARMFGALTANPSDVGLLERILVTARLVRSLTFHVDLREAENGYYRLLQTVYPGYSNRGRDGDTDDGHWARTFRELGEVLRFAVP